MAETSAFVSRKSFRLYTDVSGEAMGAVLVQVEEGEEEFIEYASKQFNPAQKNYSVIERGISSHMGYNKIQTLH